MRKMLFVVWTVGPSVVDVPEQKCHLASLVTEEDAEVAVEEEEEGAVVPSIPVTPVMSAERQVTMPETAEEEVVEDAHLPHIGDVVALTQEAGHAPGAVQGQREVA